MKVGDKVTGSFLARKQDNKYCLFIETISIQGEIEITRINGDEKLCNLSFHQIIGWGIVVCAVHTETKELHLCFRDTTGSIITWRMEI